MPITVEDFLANFEDEAKRKFEENLDLARRRFPDYFRKEIPKIGTPERFTGSKVEVYASLAIDVPELRGKCVDVCKLKDLPECENRCVDVGRAVMDLGPGGWIEYFSLTIPRDEDLEEFAKVAFSGICSSYSVEPITRYFSIVRGSGCRLETVAHVVESLKRWTR